jgi:hypothetical protein
VRFDRCVAEHAGRQCAAESFDEVDAEPWPRATRHAASATSRGSILSRWAYSPHAGRTKIEGWIRSSSPPSFSMNAAHIWRGVMPLTRPAQMKPPEETPT